MGMLLRRHKESAAENPPKKENPQPKPQPKKAATKKK